MADWDVFAKLTRAGRKASAAVASTLAGGDLDEGPVAELLDKLILAAGGVPSAEIARQVLRAAAFEGDPASGQRPSPFVIAALRELGRAARSPGTSILDLVLESRVQRAVFAGTVSEREVFTGFAEDCLLRATVDCKGGLAETLGVAAKDLVGVRSRVRRQIAGVAREAAARLLSRPALKRLHLAEAFPSTTGLATKLLS